MTIRECTLFRIIFFSTITQPLIATLSELRDSSGISRYVDAPRGNKSERYRWKMDAEFSHSDRATKRMITGPYPSMTSLIS